MNNKKGYYNFLIFAVVLGVLFLSISSVCAWNETIGPKDNINDAVNSMNGNSTIDNDFTLTLLDGTYDKSSDINNKISVSDSNVTIIGEGAVVIDALSGGTIFSFAGSNNNVSFINITFMGASDRAIYFDSTVNSISIEGCDFSDNHFSGNDGGAIYFSDAVGDVNINDSEFVNNSPSTSNGGAIFFNNNINGNVVVIGTSFIDNYAERGGAIYFKVINGNVNIVDSVFNGNNASSANFGGGALTFGGNILGTVNLVNSTFVNSNRIGNFGGGAIFFGPISSSINNLNITGCEFSNNSANGNYGGSAILILSSINGTFSIDESNFTYNNASTSTGAISIYSNVIDGMINITNSNFNFNNAGTNGGALFIVTKNPIVNIVNNNFTSNRASNGGAIYITGPTNVTIDNNIFLDNAEGAIYSDTPFIGTNIIKNYTNSSISVNDTTPTPGSEITVNGTLIDTTSGQTIGNVTIIITLGGQSLEIDVPSNGIWAYEIEVPSSTGEFNITISWNGNSYYVGFTNYITIDVEN